MQILSWEVKLCGWLSGKRTMKNELCVRCGKETEYDVHTPVTMRHFYVEGSGQLCETCWWKLYGEYDLRAISDVLKKKEGE